MDNCYSVLIYERKAASKNYDEILNYLKKGIKVYFLTASKKEDFIITLNQEELDNLENLKMRYLLSLNYEVILIGSFSDKLIIEDGKMTDNIREQLSNQNFNLEQYAIEHLDKASHVIVKAGAGTGKTKTMIDRCMFLRHKGYSDLRKITMITFTNKSALQMKAKLTERLEAYYNVSHDYKYLEWMDELSDMRIQTIHSFSKTFIEEFGDLIKIDRNSKIKSLKFEKYKILEELINEYRFKFPDEYQKIRYVPQYKLIKAIMKVENYLISRGIDIKNNYDRLDFGNEGEFKSLLSYLLINLSKSISDFKEKNSFIELNDLVANLRRFVITGEANSNINMKYIMIDEFQDTDTVQVKFIIWLIRNFGCRAFIVGDIKQSIYRFRGADYTAFEQFENELKNENLDKNKVKITLKKNYRSDKKIIESLNNFFSNIANSSDEREFNKYFNFSKEDNLQGIIENNDSSNIINYFYKEKESVKDEIAEYIIDLVEKNSNGESQDEIAVLVRSNKDLEDIVYILEERGIVCRKEVSGGFYRNIAIREFYVMLKALLFPKVYINQYAFINSSYGFGIPNDKVFENFDVSNNYLKRLIESNDDYIKLSTYRERINKEPFMIVLKDIIDNFEPHINYAIKRLRGREDLKDEDNFIRVAKTAATNYEMNLMHLFTILDNNFSSMDSSILDIEQFLNIMIQTDNIEDEKMLSKDDGRYDLTCMTVHKAKGLEFDHVVIPKTKNNFSHNNNDIKIFLKINKNEDIKVGYHIHFQEGEIEFKNDIYEDNISEEDKEVIGEEIRLLYVALTRAKKSIHINKSRLVGTSGKIHNWMSLLEKGDFKYE